MCDDISGDMNLLRLIKDWGYDSMLPQNRFLPPFEKARTRQNWGVTNYGGGGPRIWDIPYYHLARITSYSRHCDAIRIFWYIAIVIHGDCIFEAQCP